MEAGRPRQVPVQASVLAQALEQVPALVRVPESERALAPAVA
ncbi:MAG: hypothetical protein R3F15_10670 [Lysobacterales bacterium]